MTIYKIISDHLQYEIAAFSELERAEQYIDDHAWDYNLTPMHLEFLNTDGEEF